MTLEDVMFNEISQTEDDKYYMKSEEREAGKVEMVVPRGWPVGGQGEWEVGKKLVKVYNFQL